MQIKLDTQGITATQQLLEGFSERRINAAVATALTRTAVHAKDVAKTVMRSSLDRVTPYAEGGLYARPATANRLVAEVEIIDNPNITGTAPVKFLGPQVHGGERHIKRFEKALQAAGAMPYGWQSVPAAGAKLDAYGNMSRGQITQILSQVGTELTAGYTRTLPRLRGDEDAKAKRQTQNKRRRAFGRAGGQYVAIPRRKGKLAPGIYLAQARDFGARWGLGRSGRLTPVLIFVRATTYRPRFDFYGTVQEAVAQVLPRHYSAAIAEHAARVAAANRGKP